MTRNKKIAFITNPDLQFNIEIYKYWTKLGFDIDLITSYNDTYQNKEINVISAFHQLTKKEYFIFETVRIFSSFLQKIYYSFNKNKIEKAMGTEKSSVPSISHVITSAYSISRYVNKQDYLFIIGFDVFGYGLATSLCKNTFRVVQVFGGDVFMHAHTTTLAYKIVKYSLKKNDLIWNGSYSAARLIPEIFKISGDNFFTHSFGVDKRSFSLLENKEKLKSKYLINMNHKVVVNVRRFRPSWGSELAMNAFLEIAKTHDDTHFILFGGAGVESNVKEAINSVRENNLENRFTFFENNMTMFECLELMSISDISTSLMIERDMKSLSISQAVALGTFPILSDQEEYKIMVNQGLNAKLVNIENEDNIFKALDDCVRNIDKYKIKANENYKYVDEHENWEFQNEKFISRIQEGVDKKRHLQNNTAV